MNTARRKTATSSNEPDAELLRLNAEYRTLMGEINADKHNDAKGYLSAEASARWEDFEKKIADTPATTYAGIAIKLRIAAHGLRPEYPRDLETDELNLESALADADRLAGATSSTMSPETTGEDPFEALAAEWAGQKAECERLAKAEDAAGEAKFGAPSDAATDRLGEIETRIAETPTTTILGIVTKLRAEVYAEADYQFTTTENVIKTALAGAEYLLARAQEGDAELLALEADYRKENIEWNALTKDSTGEQAEAVGGRVTAAIEAFATAPANSLEGIALKMKLLIEGMENQHSFEPELAQTALEGVERLAGGRSI